MIEVTGFTYVKISRSGKSAYMPLAWLLDRIARDEVGDYVVEGGEPFFFEYLGSRPAVLLECGHHYANGNQVGVGANTMLYTWNADPARMTMLPAVQVRPKTLIAALTTQPGKYGAWSAKKAKRESAPLWRTNASTILLVAGK